MTQEVTLTMKQWSRYEVICRTLEGQLVNRDAAQMLGVSKRQLQRLKGRVRDHGARGVVHANRGRKPPHAFASQIKDQVISLTKQKYFDFNFSHLSEILQVEENLRINRETLRLWLRPMGFGGKVRKKPIHRTRRQRSSQEGNMLFLDGSPHQWFGPQPSTLILCTDDATGKPLWGLFEHQEDLNGCFQVAFEVFSRYGLPGSFYLDRASQFTTTRHSGVHVTQTDHNPTQWERAMGELGIRLIFALSPQARGRGERINRTFQDRLVSELRLKNINDPQQATRYLNEKFIPNYCCRFAVEPQDQQPAWRPLPTFTDLRDVLCKRLQRTVNNDNTISVHRQIIQLLPLPNRRHFVRAKVNLHHWVDGSYHVFHPKYGEIPCRLITPKQTAA